MTARRATALLLVLNSLLMGVIAWRLAIAHRDALVRDLTERLVSVELESMPGVSGATP